MKKTAFLKAKSIMIKNGLFYAIGLAIIFVTKYYYSKAGSDRLDWILAPTAHWVQFLSGISFEKIPHTGFVNHDHRFIITPACSGMNFIIIAFSTVFFSFIHRMEPVLKKLVWLPLCMVMSYVFTILVNSLRIIFSIYLLQLDIYNEWLTKEKVHMMVGIVIYFISLLVIYVTIDKMVVHFISDGSKEKSIGKPLSQLFLKYIQPLFWYFLITIGIPLMNRAYIDEGARFLEYSSAITVICLGAITIFLIISLQGRRNTKVK